MRKRIWIPRVGLAAGLLDASTGLALIAMPDLTRQLMAVGLDEVPLPSLRFLGAFVFAIGSLYLWGYYGLRRRHTDLWLTLWKATAWVRFCVGTVVLVQIASGELERAWISVPMTDLGLGLFQYFTVKLFNPENGEVSAS
jgi:uncharacterized protein YjeT (DUF2065 family)